MVIAARLINQKTIEQALVQAFNTWADQDINQAHWNDQFKGSKWEHSPLTRRENGETVGTPRDIYDLGSLYQSGVDSFKLTKSSSLIEASWHWDARNRSGQEYAWYVHEGKGTNDPYARRFTDDISIAASFFRKAPGMALKLRISTELNKINAI